MQITLTPGNETSSTASDGKTVNDTFDFGLVPLAAIGDYTWLDINGNGIRDARLNSHWRASPRHSC